MTVTISTKSSSVHAHARTYTCTFSLCINDVRTFRARQPSAGRAVPFARGDVQFPPKQTDTFYDCNIRVLIAPAAILSPNTATGGACSTAVGCDFRPTKCLHEPRTLLPNTRHEDRSPHTKIIIIRFMSAWYTVYGRTGATNCGAPC
jgi:hypothetical protein